MPSTAIKTLGEGRVGGYLIVWGSPQQRDLQGEYFTPETDLGLDWYARRPSLYHHGLDGMMKATVVGAIDTLKADSVGLWAEAQLDMRNRYVAKLKELIDRGIMSWSSGSLPHLVEIDHKDGRIKRWPIVEGSMTPAPAEPRRTDIRTLKAVEGIEAIYDLKELAAKAGLSDAELEDEQVVTPVPDGTAAAEGDAFMRIPPPVEDSPPPAPEQAPDASASVDVPVETPGEQPNQPEELKQEEDLLPMIEQLNAIVRAVAESLGVTLDDAQLATLVQQVNGMVQQDTGTTDATMTTDNLRASFAKADFRQKMTTAIKALSPMPTDDIMKLFNADTEASKGQGGASRVTGKGLDLNGGGGSGGNGNSGRKDSGITNVVDRRYTHLSAEDLIFGAHILKAAGKSASDQYLKAAAYKTLAKAEKETDDGALAIKTAFADDFDRSVAIKADEMLASNLSTAGQSWVGVAYETRLWEKVRMAIIYEQMISRGMFQVEIGQGENTAYIPTEGTGTTWYSLAELNDETADERLPITAKSSKPVLSRKQITPGFIGARTSFTDILDEDSLIPILPFIRSTMEKDAQEQIEYVMLNGDTVVTANTNLNLIDGTPSVDAKGRGPVYLAFDGILKLPIITTTALSRDAGTTFDEDDFTATLKLMAVQHRQDRSRLMYIMDGDTALAAANIPAVKTRDVFNPATLENGVLTRIWKIDVFETGQMALANSAGKIPAAGGTLGRLLLLRPDLWAIAWKRDVRTEVARDIDAQATVVVSTLRFAITSRSATEGAAVSYNVAV